MKKIKDVLFTVLGTIIMSFAVGAFLTPNKIVCGGVSGLSTILYQALKVEPGITYGVINILLLMIGIKVLGKEFFLKTIIGASLMTLFVQLFSYMAPITDNLILATIFGAILYGTGRGIILAVGASTGGIEILGRLVQHKYPQFPVGKLLLVMDGMVILTALIVFKDADLVLFGVISLMVSTYMVDWLISRLNLSKVVFTITEKGEEVSRKLLSTSTRGVTLVNAIGAYSAKEKQILFCAMKDREIADFQNKILSVDSNAFIVYSESQKIKGRGFSIYR